MKAKIPVSCIVATLVIIVFASVSTAAIPIKVQMSKGTILTLKEATKRVSLANPGIADLNLLTPNEILINGKSIGSTNLIIWDIHGKVTFFDVIVMGDITGLNEQIQELAPDSDVTVETASGAIVLRGNLTNDITRSKIQTISQAYAKNVINFIEIPEAKQILLEVRVAQINKSKLKELGIGVTVTGIGENNAEVTFPGLTFFPSGSIGALNTITRDLEGTGGLEGSEFVKSDIFPGISGFGLGANQPQIAVGHFPSGVAAMLRALTQKGYGKVLAEPNLIVRSGQEGTFHVGKKIPIQTVSDGDVSVSFEDVGVKLNFVPVVLETDVIRLKIDPAEVSSLARYVTLQGILAPEIDTRTVNTSVDLREGESLVIAGLLSEDMKKNIQKLPILGDIPILGALFRTSRDELEESELAFFITPKLVKPMPPGMKKGLPGDEPLTPEEEKEFRWIPVP
jgi:pilus assembly protein CpaC